MTSDIRTTVPGTVVPAARLEPRRVPFDAPWNWLAAGWRDLWQTPQIGLFFGLVVTAGAAVLIVSLLRLDALSLTLALAGGFMLIGPLFAVGLYLASRRMSRNQAVGLGETLLAWRSAQGQLAFFGMILLFVFLVWLQLAFLLLMLFVGGAAVPPPSAFVQTLLFTPRGLGLLVVGTAVGGLLALGVFAISALAVPMLLVREVDAVSAARASIAAIIANPKPMLLWAALIVVIMGAGFTMLLVGLVVAFPLIGHATWHAYADVFGDP